MNLNKILSAVAIIVLLIFVLFEFDLAQDIDNGGSNEVPDPEIEARYENCYAIKDDEMHRRAFGTIDNPDVQREYISANRALIAAECRGEFPQETIIVEDADPPNLVNIRPRFW